MHYLNLILVIVLVVGVEYPLLNYKAYLLFKRDVFDYYLAQSSHLIMLVIMKPVQEHGQLLTINLGKTIV